MVSLINTGIRTNGVQRKSIAAFSMIELLVVIAIIALLAAIIFPVFATVRENGRQSASISNMHDISVKMEQYKLDTQHYPPVLFGYAKPGVSMDKLLAACTADNSCDTYLPGLYPEYVKSWTEFQDPNNNAKVDATVHPVQVELCSGSGDVEANCTPGGTEVAPGTLVLKSADNWKSMYSADAYDSSPQLASANSLNGTPITRYQPSWTGIAGTTLDCGTNLAGAPATAVGEDLCKGSSTTDFQNTYLNQLRWKNPPSTTYVTSTTYHVQQAGIVLVLLQDGSVKKVDAAKFYNLDKTNSLTVDANGVYGTKFWKVTL